MKPGAPLLRWLRGLCVLLACAAVLAGCARPPVRTIALIGGSTSEAPGRHDYPDGIRALQALLHASPEARRGTLRVLAFPDGWPREPGALDAADTLVWYFDGVERHPLREPAVQAQVERLMRRGVGLVALHQASTLPPGDDHGLAAWLGAVREGMADRSTQWAPLAPALALHPVVRGLPAFDYRDEFYPTLRFAPGSVPLLQAELEVQFRAGARLVEATPERTTVAWALQRGDGGRAVGFTGAHFLAALDEPPLRRFLLNAMLWTAGLEVPVPAAGDAPAPGPSTTPETAAQASAADWPTFQRDPLRSGWDDSGQAPDRAQLQGGGFGLAWESPRLDGFEGHPPRLYASPLYLDALRLGAGPLRGETFPVVLAASNTGYVYAINASDRADIAAGRILWRTRLGEPCRLRPAPLDGIPTGILSTPVADAARARLYVTHCDPQQGWQAYALDLASGRVLSGWPVRLDEETLNAVNRNAGSERVPPRRKHDFRVQRAALNLSPDGQRLYVGFGETETGWTVSVDTAQARVHSAFASQAMPHRGAGGLWGSGGPAVDEDGHVYVVTGSGFEGYKAQPHDWTQSVLKFADTEAGLQLRGTYTPFNHCRSATADIDLGSGGALLVPADAQAPGPRLLVVGGKQGNAYLLDRDRLPGALDWRPDCDTPAWADGSLLPPTSQPQFGTRGPLNVFGPYSEDDGAMDIARARSVPAFYRDAQGARHVLLTGNTRQRIALPDARPPSLVRLRIETGDDAQPYLAVAARQDSEILHNPGPAVITSHGGREAIAWVLDENARRSASLAGDDAPRPVLYAFDATTLALLWRSAPGQLYTSGKYNAPAFARGLAVVGTDRIQAFGRTDRPLPGGSARPPVAVDAPRLPAADAAQIAAVDAAALYAARCAACHDQPFGNIPPRAVIAAHPLPRVLDALAHGAMRAQAAGLSSAEIQALGRYLTQ